MITWILAGLAGALLVGIVFFFGVFLPWGLNWGSTGEERAAPMAADRYLEDGPAGRKTVTMTRAISIAAPPETVWAWVRQMGRGAGYYSVERLDNGGKTSASHIVTWIPEPQLGDATDPGFIVHLEPGKELAILLPGLKELGVWERLTGDYLLTPEGAGTRLVCRIVGEAVGGSTWFFKWAFAGIDTLMSWRQLIGIRRRAETFGVRDSEDLAPETGERDQYQAFEVIYASGERAGMPGKASAALWHEIAREKFGDQLGATSGSIPKLPHPLEKSASGQEPNPGQDPVADSRTEPE